MTTEKEYLTSILGSDRTSSIFNYLSANNCVFSIVKPRKTKFGDFRQKGNSYKITVNQGLSKYRFVLTFIHELAHLKTHIEYGRQAKPHGVEWKQNFRSLYKALDLKTFYSEDLKVLNAIEKEMINPKACGGVNYSLEEALISEPNDGTIGLKHVSANACFIFRKERYRKINIRRTRALCLRVSNGKKYTISLAARVHLC